MKFGLLLLALLVESPVQAGNAPITRAMLLADCPIPERREFPLGPESQACENFHEYACGAVEKSFQLPANRSSWSFSFQDSAERLLYAKKRYFHFLEKGFSPRTARAAQLKDYYLGCVNTKARKGEELTLVEHEKSVLAGVHTKDDLASLLVSRLKNPDFSFVEFGDDANQKDPKVKDVILAAGSLSLPEKTYYENAEIVADLQTLAVAFFKAVGSDQPEQRAQWVVDFEKAYAKASPTPLEMRKRETENNYRSREDFIRIYPNLKLERFFALLPQQILIRDLTPELLTFVSEAIDKEPLEKIKSVLLFHRLKGELDEAYPDFFALSFQFNHTRLGGPKERAALAERCTKTVMRDFMMELDEELLPILFPQFPAKRVRDNAEKVRQAIVAGLEKNEWLSESAREEAIKKMSTASLLLVKPKTERDWHFLPKAKYSSQSPIANARKVAQLKIDQLFQELGEKRNSDRWHMGPLTVNAYYSPPDNQFVLPQAILQPPFFDVESGDVQNIGAMGPVIAHELGHGIDDQGNQYDASGRVRNWMTDADHAAFSLRSNGFVDLFKSLGHNGELTLGENIGDHVGLTFSFAAAFPQGQATLEQTRDFYLAYARVWCGVMTPKYAERMLKTNPHSLGWARINGQVIHHDAFVDAFSCKPGQKMYLEPSKRLRVW